MKSVEELFGSLVFDSISMKQRLPKEVYEQIKMTKEQGVPLSPDAADIMANALKDWAIEKGATHFAHWFQPMTGVTAEKHDSFITPADDDQVIMKFSGKELIKSEPDASSFPSGGLRSTFEARGYTAWDPTVNAFIKDHILCIPTIFCSYTGEALDKKTPLMRSLEALNKHALRVLRLLGDTETTHISTSVGLEQEYFLIDRKIALKRRDITLTGRTLFGTPPAKGQELDDHYFGVVKSRVSEYMRELDRELWKLGILAKTKHNEAAPSQHELAPIFSAGNLATDHNQLTMELMKRVAEKHSLKCLLHEKPFQGVNGSGKHDNWSICTNNGENLLKPGKNPYTNIKFLVFLCAVIQAVDEYQDLLRMSVATAGNDHRLGAAEAPPAIISIFLGDELYNIIEAIDAGHDYTKPQKQMMETGGIDAVPNFVKDTTDRNRTSPFAFTGNKFEFRMPGSSLSASGPNFLLNTAVADALMQFADFLEEHTNLPLEEAVHKLLCKTIKEHKRILYNGNNYSEEWVKEAEKRGLSNLRSTPEAIAAFIDQKNLDLLSRHGILSEGEVYSRYEINLENYSKVINIEAQTMSEMTRQDILPPIEEYVGILSQTLLAKKQAFPDISALTEESLVPKLSEISSALFSKAEELEQRLCNAKNTEDVLKKAFFYRDEILPLMEEIRTLADTAEKFIPKDIWKLPSYEDLLFSIQE